MEYEKRRKEILLSVHLGRGRDEWMEWKSGGCEVRCTWEGNNMEEEGDIFQAARRDGEQRRSADNEVQGKQRLAG